MAVKRKPKIDVLRLTGIVVLDIKKSFYALLHFTLEVWAYLSLVPVDIFKLKWVQRVDTPVIS